MIIELLSFLSDDSPLSGLFGYISVRAAAAAITAFLIALFLGPRVIAWLRHTGVGEQVNLTDSKTLAALHRDKQGTPTMGGVFMIGAMLVACVLWMRFDGEGPFSAAAIFLVAWFALVGFWDDWIKLKVPGRKGLSIKAKQAALTIGALVVAVWLMEWSGLEQERGGPHLYFPFFKDLSWDLSVAMGIPFVAVAVLVLTGSANAVNLTDGLDGLAIGCIAMASVAFAGITYFVGHSELSSYLLVEHVAGSAEITVMLGAMLGAALGFLWFNASPALVFMGDVGSLALGGALGIAALVSRTELVLLVVGGVFVVEAISVIIQVLFFKTTGRRVFRCAPLHHHFQFGGMPENRLVVRTWVVSALLAMTSLALFKVR